jgi:hypothetical protein
MGNNVNKMTQICRYWMEKTKGCNMDHPSGDAERAVRVLKNVQRNLDHLKHQVPMVHIEDL